MLRVPLSPRSVRSGKTGCCRHLVVRLHTLRLLPQLPPSLRKVRRLKVRCCSCSTCVFPCRVYPFPTPSHTRCVDHVLHTIIYIFILSTSFKLHGFTFSINSRTTITMSVAKEERLIPAMPSHLQGHKFCTLGPYPYQVPGIPVNVAFLNYLSNQLSSYPPPGPGPQGYVVSVWQGRQLSDYLVVC